MGERVGRHIEQLKTDGVLSHQEVKMVIKGDLDHVKKLAAGALKHSDPADQVEHVIADTSLSPIQRRMALDLLRKDQKREPGAG